LPSATCSGVQLDSGFGSLISPNSRVLMREIQALDPTVDPDQTIRHFLFWPLGQSQGSGGAHQPNAAPALKLTAAATQTASFGIAPTGQRIPAQGNALGSTSHPMRVLKERCIPPLRPPTRALCGVPSERHPFPYPHPGFHPGLVCRAPLGHPNHRRTHLGLVGHPNELSTDSSRVGGARQ
jgi:hypothetical protein